MAVMVGYPKNMRPEGFWDSQLGYEDEASLLNLVQF